MVLQLHATILLFFRFGPAVNDYPGKSAHSSDSRPALYFRTFERMVETSPHRIVALVLRRKRVPCCLVPRIPPSIIGKPGAQVSDLDNPVCMQNHLHVADSMPDRACLACLLPQAVCIYEAGLRGCIVDS